ncbi:hypothetical protein FQ185_18555 [Pseudomonas sp. ANT_H12B]|nr:hypothetical protein FQ185_18555 [Pseudomonas sp. ANT_H12B]
MNLENIRYHLAVTCLVLGCSGLPAAIVVWCITQIVPLEGKHLKITYLITYVTIAIFGLRFYIPKLRGLT